ncbi:uncharacterized protein ACO6RY_15594 [Pungitius sinensis]
MSQIRSLYVSGFVSSKRNEAQPGQSLDRNNRTNVKSRYQSDKRGNKRANVEGGKNPFLLKVKLQKFHGTLSEKVEVTPRRCLEYRAANKTETTVSRQGSATDSDSVGVLFSQRPTITASNKDKAKLAVLRTISRMLEENQLIRQRLATVSQA